MIDAPCNNCKSEGQRRWEVKGKFDIKNSKACCNWSAKIIADQNRNNSCTSNRLCYI